MNPTIEELGKRILATCIAHPEAIPLAITNTREEMYTGVNLQVFRKIKDLNRSGRGVSFDSIQESSQLDPQAVMEILLAETGNVEELAQNIRNVSTLDLITRSFSELHKEQDVAKAFFKIVNTVSAQAIMSNGSSGSMDEVMIRTLEKINERRSQNISILGMPTKHKIFNHMTEGFLPGLHILMGRPGMGKTSLAIDFMQDQARRDKKVGFVSLEMSDERIATTVMADFKMFDRVKVRKGHLNQQQINELHHLPQKPWVKNMYLEVFPGKQIEEVMGAIYKLRGRGCDIVFVDHIHHMRDPRFRNNPERMFAEIATTMADAANQHDFPIVSLAQMNRNSVSRADKRPLSSDLKFGSVIDEVAEVIMGVWRPSVDGIVTDETGMRIPDGAMELIIRKNRETGDTGIIPMRKIVGGIFEEDSEELIQADKEYTIADINLPPKSIDGEDLPF